MLSYSSAVNIFSMRLSLHLSHLHYTPAAWAPAAEEYCDCSLKSESERRRMGEADRQRDELRVKGEKKKEREGAGSLPIPWLTLGS